MNNYTIFVVEDDRAIRSLIATTLEIQGYKYEVAMNGKSALMGIISSKPDIIILDLGLPDIDGVEIITKIRSWSDVPIIVVSARSDDKDKINALDAGADDYLTKPFSIDELLARLRVTVRRLNNQNSHSNSSDKNIFINGDLKIDYAAGCTYLNNTEIHLTPNEFKLLSLLAKNVGKVLTHNYILKEIWTNALPYDTQSLRVFMATLRKKIEPDTSNPKYIQTHIGVGYRMLKIDDTIK
ncbi:MAG: response regulator transcription factor [Clostridium sp.]|uniref:response regulator n=1 Tax=Clostridium culturomicium TaxID=1499683 RepID=UPI00058FFA1F|nr:response regulator transcription factor [Clostridium culturomicium]MDU4891985.1 response regulator transcription factor [Clostridium sp.]MDU7084544.1 response regulator transcription factor [Clostridium sp.]